MSGETTAFPQAQETFLQVKKHYNILSLFLIKTSPTLLNIGINSPSDGMSSVAASGQPSGVPFLDNSSDEESGT